MISINLFLFYVNSFIKNLNKIKLKLRWINKK